MKFLVVMTVFTGLVIACGDSNSHILGGDSGSKTAPLSPGNASGGENSGGGNTSGGNSGGNGGGYISDQFCIHPEEINDISDINLDAYRCENNKFQFCHFPPGNPANAHIVIIPEAALQTHFNVGGYLQKCWPTVKAGDRCCEADCLD